MPVLLALWLPSAAQAADCNGIPATHTGTEAANFIEGSAGADVIAGLGGDDEIWGGGGNDVICGGDGRDVVYHYSTPEAPSGFTEVITLPEPGQAGSAVGTAGNDTLVGIEDAFGTDYADRIVGSSGHNALTGGEGERT